MVERILILSNLRMCLIYFLAFGTDINNSLIIIDDSIKLNILIGKAKIIRVGKAKGLFSLIINSLYLYLNFYFILCFHAKLDRKTLKAYGADHILGAKFFLKRFNFYLIEDGSINYSPKTYVRSLKNKLFSIPVFGLHKNVKKMYLTSANNLPSNILHKVEIVNIKKLWDSKSEQGKKEIFGIFGVKDEILSTIREKRYILYTQPLSEDGVLSQEEKIDIYKSILSELRIDTEKLVIKIHPREKTNYYEYFPDSYVLEDNIPAELIAISCHNFEKVVTLFSTSVYEHEKSLVHFYGTKVHNKLIERFGNIEFDH